MNNDNQNNMDVSEINNSLNISPTNQENIMQQPEANQTNSVQNNNEPAKQKKNKKGKTILIIILILLVLSLGGYIVYDKFINKPVNNNTETDCSKCNNINNKEQNDKSDNSNETNSNSSNNNSNSNSTIVKEVDKINNGKRAGIYSIYMGQNGGGEDKMLILFNTGDNSNGFFELITAFNAPANGPFGGGSSFGKMADGSYSINGSTIEFYNNMDSDSIKNEFVNGFEMKISDLYQDSNEVSKGYQNQYRLKLHISDDTINNSNLTLKKVL